MKKTILTALILIGFGVIYLHGQPSFAEEKHDHSSHEESHDEDDGDDHAEDHNNKMDSHDEHGHEEHQKEDSHDDHGHKDGHDDGGDKHEEKDEHGHEDEHGDEHEESKTDIDPDHAQKAGIVLSKAQGGAISQNIALTGQIILNSNRSAEVKARFTGQVRSVKVELGQNVKKGQVLASVESNESLQVFNVTAPISGTILKRNTNVGNLTSDEPLFTIVDLSKVWAKFHIFPKDTAYIQEGQSVTVHTLGNIEKEATSSIKMLLPTADALSQTYVAIVELDNENSDWRPGMTVEGDVSVSQTKADVIIPESAIQTMEDQSVIFVENNNEYEMRPVKLGKYDNKNIEIVSGLSEGESYVSQGSFVIKADILKSGAAHEH
jgi:cobalt-zinc-cadmium efflux system membrane fusion protein